MPESQFELVYQGESFNLSTVDASKLMKLLDDGMSAFWRFTPQGSTQGVGITVSPQIPLVLRSTGSELNGHGDAANLPLG